MSIPGDLAAPLAEAVKRETKGERVRWSGRPSPRRALLSSLGIWLFAVPWTAFSLVMMGLMLGGPLSGKPVPASLGNIGAVGVVIGVLFLLPFVLAGFAMMGAPFYAARVARRTIYVITDKRLLTISASRRKTAVKTFWPQEIVSMERTERSDGSGSLKLVLGSSRDSDGDKVTTSETLGGVADIRRAEELLAELRTTRRAA